MTKFINITEKDLNYLLAKALKACVQEFKETACNDFSKLDAFLELDETLADELLCLFVGTDHHSPYIFEGEIYYDGDGSILMPSTKEVIDILAK